MLKFKIQLYTIIKTNSLTIVYVYMYFLFYNVVGIWVYRYAGGVEHAHYTVHIVSIINTRRNSYITSIDMRCGKVANLNYAVFLSFLKLTLENKVYYLYIYSFGKLPLEPVRYTLAKYSY